MREYLVHSKMSTHIKTLNGYTGRRAVQMSFPSGWTTRWEYNYSSGFVLIKETTRSPSFHWPLCLKSSTRSKRFSTFRLTANPPGGLKLGCLLIIVCIVIKEEFLARKLHLRKVNSSRYAHWFLTVAKFIILWFTFLGFTLLLIILRFLALLT